MGTIGKGLWEICKESIYETSKEDNEEDNEKLTELNKSFNEALRISFEERNINIIISESGLEELEKFLKEQKLIK